MSFFTAFLIKDFELSVRRLIQLMRGKAVVDTLDRQRMTAEAWGSDPWPNLVSSGTSVTAIAGVTPRVVTATDSTIGTLSNIAGDSNQATITNVTQLASVPAQWLHVGNSRIQYNKGIRDKLTNT